MNEWMNVLITICLIGSDSKIPDQASQLCTACGLASPNLFLMPYVDRPEGYINRYEWMNG